VTSRSAPGGTLDQQRRVELAAAAGMLGSVLFVSVFTIYGWMSPGYSPTLDIGLSLMASGPFTTDPSRCRPHLRDCRAQNHQDPGNGLFEWKGLVQRIVLATFMAWIFAVASRLRHVRRRAGSGNCS
jgi:hypothetical protein